MNIQKKGRATLKSVASEAGVAVSTVSNILNRRKDSWASEETQQRVFDAAEKLGYVPNAAARGLRLNRFNVVLIILPDLINPFFVGLVREIQRSLRELGYESIFEETNFEVEQEKRLLKSAPSRLIDGVIAVTVNTTAVAETLSMAAKKIPIVHLGALPEDTHVDRVSSDIGVGQKAAVEHLIQLGHERIGYIDSLTSVVGSAARIERFRHMLVEHDLSFREEWWVRTSTALADIHQSVRDWIGSLDEGSRPSALFCSNDFTAIAVMRGLRDAEIRVPEEMSVIGFNNIELCDYLPCSLTTIEQPVGELSESACRMIIDRISNGGTETYGRVLHPTRLLIRESVAPCTQPG